MASPSSWRPPPRWPRPPLDTRKNWTTWWFPHIRLCSSRWTPCPAFFQGLWRLRRRRLRVHAGSRGPGARGASSGGAESGLWGTHLYLACFFWLYFFIFSDLQRLLRPFPVEPRCRGEHGRVGGGHVLNNVRHGGGGGFWRGWIANCHYFF